MRNFDIAHTIKQFNSDEDNQKLIRSNVSERSICSAFAVLLAEELKNAGYDDGIHVDVEYNRYSQQEKTVSIKGEEKSIYADLVVHKRGTDVLNLLCIEMKKSNNQQPHHDLERLEEMTNPQGKYRYQQGYFIVADIEKGELNVKEVFPK